MAAFSGTFECPNGFVEEDIMGQLFLEDLNDDCELWLIRMPSDVKLSALDKKKILLSDSSNLITFNTEDDKVFECFSEKCDIPNLCAILPQKSDNKLHEVRKIFKGSILVTESLHPNDPFQVKNEVTDILENDTNSEFFDATSSSKKKKKSKTLDEQFNETEDRESMSFLCTQKRSSSKNIFDVKVKNEQLSSDRDEFPICTSQYI